jgi:hypothetical protein
MDLNYDELVISCDKALLNMETIFGFLARSYWADKKSGCESLYGQNAGL